MFRHLQYEVTFPSTERTLSETIDFEKGFGAITGPNGAGKSFALEAIRWLLFGTAALRGKAEDYKTLKGSLTFTVRERTFTIERTTRGAKLIEGDELLVSGTSPVNHKVAQLLGFGLTVFDVACVANQGDIEKLGTMKPTERKQMVDSVLGLSVLDDITRWAGDEALVLKREATAIADNLVEPVEPVKPEGYLPASELQEMITEKQRLHNELMQHRAVPAAGPCPTTLTIEELDRKAEIVPLLAELKAMPPAPTWTEEELAEEERRIEAASWRGLTEPRYSRDQLNQWLEDHEVLDQIRVKNDLQKQIDRLVAGAITCPACDHCWTEDDTVLDHLKAELAQFPEELVAPATPPLRMVNCLQMLDDWTEFDAQPPKPDLPPPQLSHNQIAAERHKLTFAARRAELEELTKDHDGTDYVRLKHQLETWRERSNAYQDAQIEIERLTPLVEDLHDLRILLTEVKLYEALVQQYITQRGTYEDGLARVAELTTQSENWSKVKVALSTLRQRVKQHLVPSLNKVASYLITQMTGGVKQQIVVDENFEVLVDNQSLNTLSGSEKAVANLALRIGLGQVLTSNVMSLFIGDEIDASMDNERAENTARCLRNLAQNLSQVLLVTHKYPEADYYVTIGKTHGLPESNSG